MVDMIVMVMILILYELMCEFVMEIFCLMVMDVFLGGICIFFMIFCIFLVRLIVCVIFCSLYLYFLEFGI